MTTDLTVEEIITTHCKQRKLITNNKIKSYNYKFLMRTIPYEKHLHTMKLKPTPICESCGIDEDIIHLYWDCPKTRRLWERLKQLIEELELTPFPLDKKNCLLGIGTWISAKHKERCQSMCILIKYHIHLQKCTDENNTRSPKGLDNYIKNILKTEHTIAQEKGTQNQFTRNWRLWMNWIYS